LVSTNNCTVNGAEGKKKACATGANDLSLKSVDVPEVPHAVRVLGGKNAHNTKPHQLLTKLLTK